MISKEIQELNNLQRWFIVIAIMSATLMQVLDTTIVNVALPHMQGSLSASPDQISWTLTSYLVASGIFIPLTGYFSDILGRKNYLLWCITGFTLASILCGAAQTLTQLIIFRLLQGIFGAGLVPLSQSILTDIFPQKEHGKAMAIWGTGVMVGPILGPTLGGYLTEVLNWRWTFYVNVPVGIFAVLLTWKVVPNTIKKIRNMDWVGLVFLSFGIGALQYLLDRGNDAGWLSSGKIKFALSIAVFGIIGFILHSLRKSLKNTNEMHKSVFDIHIFKDINFTVSSIILAVLGLGLYGAIVIQPMMLESQFNYPVLTTGLVMAPRGIASMLAMILVGKLVNKYDHRLLIAIGIILSCIGIGVCTFYSPTTDIWWFIWPILLQGFGTGMIFVPLAVIAFSTLPKSMNVDGAGMFSLLRTIGSSIGIAITLTFYTRHGQMAWNQLGGFFNIYNPAFKAYLSQLHVSLMNKNVIVALAGELYKQAQIVTYVNVFAFIMWAFLAMLPLVLMLKSKRQ